LANARFDSSIPSIDKIRLLGTGQFWIRLKAVTVNNRKNERLTCCPQVAAGNRRHPDLSPIRAFGLANARFDSVLLGKSVYWGQVNFVFIGDRSILGPSKGGDDQRGTGRVVEWSSMVGANPPPKFQGTGLNGTSVARLKAGTG
jgi:hypothetical protein